MPAWRNGRRTGLKILSSQERIGSSPIAGTTEKPLYIVDFRFNLLYIVVFSFCLFCAFPILCFPQKTECKMFDFNTPNSQKLELKSVKHRFWGKFWGINSMFFTFFQTVYGT